MEAAGIGTTVYTLLGFMRKILLNPVLRFMPSLAAKRSVKVVLTNALMSAVKAA
jgi:hypothetical protein